MKIHDLLLIGIAGLVIGTCALSTGNLTAGLLTLGGSAFIIGVALVKDRSGGNR